MPEGQPGQLNWAATRRVDHRFTAAESTACILLQFAVLARFPLLRGLLLCIQTRPGWYDNVYASTTMVASIIGVTTLFVHSIVQLSAVLAVLAIPHTSGPRKNATSSPMDIRLQYVSCGRLQQTEHERSSRPVLACFQTNILSLSVLQPSRVAQVLEEQEAVISWVTLHQPEALNRRNCIWQQC